MFSLSTKLQGCSVILLLLVDPWYVIIHCFIMNTLASLEYSSGLALI